MKIQKLGVSALQNNFISFAGKKKNAPAAAPQEACGLKSSEIMGNYGIASIQINKGSSLKDRIKTEEADIAYKLNEIDIDDLEISNMQEKVWREAKEQYESAYEAYRTRNIIAKGTIGSTPLIENTTETTIDETDEDNNLTRQIEYTDGVPKKITVINPDGTKDIYEYDALLISNGYNAFTNLNFAVKKGVKNQKAKMMFEFQNSDLINAYKEVEFDGTDFLSAKKMYNLSNGETLFCYGEGLKGTTSRR